MNAFTDIPESEPSRVVAGDFWTWKRTDLGTDYVNTAHTLSYVLRLEGGTTDLTLTATNSGDDYLIEALSAATAAYGVGRWHWVAFITRTSDSQRVKIDEGVLIVDPDPANVDSDPRSHAQIVLAKIEAVIENRADKDVLSYSINGRSLSKFSVEDLLTLRRTYRKQVNAEKNLARRKAGKATTNLRVVSFKNG